ncbi:MAG: UDP-N-acetylmuramoyl-tripeptide-D-alanyl-D-alanine ligase [Candidatus Jorgensenbacteria bacterium GW2011_GWA1_48_13]|uniref:UDP-N-acetylmuramoyl-tripeptide-D-alanyl-D-alanine ligase n=2 Tax=Candidatus Joergenseniibacteriota TaxID=1752739 RepID=A0A0G1W8T1_9BACT|nr:MAG: UDP-N-acetylmuramoyl-tripeptide-D-alanyl-D-alanine ligase [Candidatus Jorgensenbacteria bacterium GW2011_GWA1_48_13]KKU98650.1 MAG: UDP-N-acetylmuramoyl-tripeptide-D-alanyl-D-alanine ligase [Candidatus Jorgensenbacteria bacterium GW2011_GWC1_48_8]KKW15118.1 MAG: UDP-N-acetylmuramoyl-tripeptide-D-alanyl-D-alanine ligase [Candidatus Jorgensenbacteria bacterium GW2011_GWB1_50_10]
MKRILLKPLAGILRWLAALTLNRYKPSLIGVTGSVGKTSAKMAIAAVLGSSRKVRASGKSFNNEIGLPLTILGDWDRTEGRFFWFKVFFFAISQLVFRNPNYPELIVLEYGVDRPDDMNYLLRVAKPHIGVVTAIGEVPVHVEFFAGPEKVAEEKTKLVAALPATGFAILNADDEVVSDMKEQARAHPVTYGFESGTDVCITNFENRFEKDFRGAVFKLSYAGNIVPVKIRGAFGKTYAYAAAAAASVGLIYGLNLVRISEALLEFNPPPGRLRLISGEKESFIIDDTYNSSPTATHEALDVLRSLKAKRKIAVLGDMLELGKYTLLAHEGIGKLAAKSADIIMTLGMKAKFIAERAVKSGVPRRKVFAFTNLEECARALEGMIQKGDLILVKGSQGVRMEKIVLEVMAEPQRARELLVRQSPVWWRRKSLYE